LTVIVAVVVVVVAAAAVVVDAASLFYIGALTQSRREFGLGRWIL